MVLIEAKLKDDFPCMPLTFPTSQVRRKLRSSDADSRPRGAYLILQLHDELIYEVKSAGNTSINLYAQLLMYIMCNR